MIIRWGHPSSDVKLITEQSIFRETGRRVVADLRALRPGARPGHTRGNVNAALGLDGAATGTVDGPGSSPLTGICVSAVPVSPYLRAVYANTGKGRYTLADLTPGRYRIEFQSGCGLTGMATQWWQGAASKAAATVIAVGVSDVVAGIDATMKA